MIKLAKKDNPTARFAIMDSRKIYALETKYGKIICGYICHIYHKLTAYNLIPTVINY